MRRAQAGTRAPGSAVPTAASCWLHCVRREILIQGERATLAPDLKENLAKADAFEADFVRAVDEYIERNGLDVPKDSLPLLRDGYEAATVTELDLKSSGISTVVWATSYNFDFSFIKLPILDGDGYPIQKRGVTNFAGLYFVGLPWLHDAKSGLLYGVGGDSAYIASWLATTNGSAREYARQPRPRSTGSPTTSACA